MENFRQPLAPYMFLVRSFFSLHRRRQIGQHGIQPIPYGDMADYADRVLRLPDCMRSMYFAAVEAADNGVLYDYYAKQTAETEALKQEAAQRPGGRRPRKPPPPRKGRK